MAALPNASNPIATRLRKKRDLETTMNTLKQLLEPSIISTRKGSRKKNKPRSLRVAKAIPSNKTISRTEICTANDGEYYPNKLKRTVQSKKTILKPTHKLKVVVTTNKRKRCTPHKGIQSLYKETPPPDINVQAASDNINVHTAPDNVFVLTTPGTKNTVFGNIDCTSTLPGNKDVHPTSGNGNVHSDNLNVHSDNLNVHSDNLNVHSDNLNIHTTSLQIHTPPPSNVVKYDLISPPHKSLTQLTTDDLIRMDEDSLCDEDLMEILTCPSPVWWEDPEDNKGSLYLSKAPDGSITENKNGEKQTITGNSSNKGVNMKRTNTVSVTKYKANKIAKLENILGHIKSLVQNDDKLIIPGILKNIDNLTNDVINDNVNRTVNDEEHIEVNNKDNDKIVNEIGNDETYSSKLRTNSSSGSDISVNDDDLLRNLECINIPIQSTDRNESDVGKSIDNAIIPIDNNEINRRKCNEAEKESPHKSKVIEKTSGANKCDKNVNVLNKKKKLMNKANNKIKKPNIIRVSDEKTPKTMDEISSESKHKSILKKLKQNDDILDVRLIKTPTNITNEVKIWSKLDNFKRHNFKPQDFQHITEVIDVEEELQFSIIESKSSPKKEHDPLDIKNETILIDDDSNDGLDTSTVNMIETDAVEQLNDITITAITGNYESTNNEVTELTVIKEELSEKQIDDHDVINEDTIRIGNVLDVRLIETSDTAQDDTLLTLNRKRKNAAGLSAPRKQYTNNTKKNKNTLNTEKLNNLKLFPIKTIESLQQSLNANIHEKYIEQLNEDSKNKNNSLLNIINSANANDIIRLNDLDVSLVTSSSPRKDDKNDENITKNDLSITFVNKTDHKSIATPPLSLPMLMKNPTKPILESPKSVISSNSESTVELSEGTISDTNIQYLDEYEDNKIIYEEQSEIKSESDLECDTEDNTTLNEQICSVDIDPDQTVEHRAINDGSETKTCQDEDIKIENTVLDLNEDNYILDDEFEQNEIDDRKNIENSDENVDNKSINSQDFDEEQDTSTNKEEFVTIYKILSTDKECDKDEKSIDHNDGNINDNFDIDKDTSNV